MSEEEKEAIEEVKRIIEEIEEIYHYDCDREDEKYLKIVLNCINEYEKRITFLREEIYGLNKKTKRLQKENEKLKEDNYNLDRENQLKFDKIIKENEDMREELQMYVDTDIMKLQEENKDLKKEIDNLIKENKQLRQEVEEYNKRGQTLRNIATQKDSKMYELICKDFIPKDKIEEMLMRNKAILKVVQDEIEERIVVADSDSLNVGRIQAHSLIIADLEKLLGDDK